MTGTDTTRNPDETSVNCAATKSEDPPYSIYTKKEKWFIVLLIAVSGLFSPLTSSIYFPAIPVIAHDFNRSIELINLTVTMYMILQGIAPMFFGSLADYVGRRLIYISCLTILSISCVGLALVPTNAYWLLMVLRCLQAAGSTSTIALGAGVIGDIAEPYERGGFMGTYGMGPLVGPALGPVIGGALTGTLGWRSLFWFLVAAAGIACIIVMLFLPETLRSIVGDGSIMPPVLLRPIIPILARYKTQPESETQSTGQNLDTTKTARRRFRNPLILLKYPDIPLILFFNGMVAAVFYGVMATISSVFVEVYPSLTQTEIGLCYLCIGGGMFLGSFASGVLLDWEWTRVSKSYFMKRSGEQENSDTVMDMKKARDDPDFPVEYARLRSCPYIMVFYVAAVIAYGWCIQNAVHISAPLILQFIVGLGGVLTSNAIQTVTIDLVPNQSSSVSACNNLFRGLLGAALVSVVDLILKALSPGWTYVLFGCICAVLTPLVWVVIRIGPRCRRRRREIEEGQMDNMILERAGEKRRT